MPYQIGDIREDLSGREWKLCTYILLDPRPGVLSEVRTGWMLQPKRRVRRYLTNPTREYYERIEQMKDDMESNQRKAGKWVPPADEFLKPYPTIAQFMTDCFFDNGKKRVTSKLSIRYWGDQVDISLNDEEKRRSCTTTSRTLHEALELLEAHLASGGAPWRFWGEMKKK